MFVGRVGGTAAECRNAVGDVRARAEHPIHQGADELGKAVDQGSPVSRLDHRAKVLVVVDAFLLCRSARHPKCHAADYAPI